jgi:predicted enzyme related to lactoylglutathione lyase
MAARIVHFEITADDLPRAVGFYRAAFGWELSTWGGGDEYWLASTGEGPGIDGALMARAYEQAVITTVGVDEPIEQVLARVTALGGEVLTAVGDIPGVGRHAYVRDTEGNVLALLEPAAGG